MASLQSAQVDSNFLVSWLVIVQGALARDKSCQNLQPRAPLPKRVSTERDPACPAMVMRPTTVEIKAHDFRLSACEASHSNALEVTLGGFLGGLLGGFLDPIERLAVKKVSCLWSAFAIIQCQTLLALHTASDFAFPKDGFQFTANCFSTRVQCTVEGLGEVLQQLDLQAYEGQIFSWCDDMGAVELDEIVEVAEQMSDAVGLHGLDRDRLLAWAANYFSDSCCECGRANPSRLSFCGQGDGYNHRERLLAWRTDSFTASKTGHGQANLSIASSCEEDNEDVQAFSQVRWSSPLASILEYFVEEDEHLKFQIIIEPSAEQRNDDDDDEIEFESCYYDILGIQGAVIEDVFGHEEEQAVTPSAEEYADDAELQIEHSYQELRNRCYYPSLKRQLTTVAWTHKEDFNVLGTGVDFDPMDNWKQDLVSDFDDVSSVLTSYATPQSNKFLGRRW